MPGGVRRENAHAERKTAGEATGPRRRTKRSAGVKAVEAHAVFGHRIEMRCANIRVAVEPDIAPALVVAHQQNDVRCTFGVGGDGEQEERNEEAKFYGGSVWPDATNDTSV